MTAARNPMTGADMVSRLLLGVLERDPAVDVIDHETSRGLGFVAWIEGRTTGVATVG